MNVLRIVKAVAFVLSMSCACFAADDLWGNAETSATVTNSGDLWDSPAPQKVEPAKPTVQQPVQKPAQQEVKKETPKAVPAESAPIAVADTTPKTAEPAQDSAKTANATAVADTVKKDSVVAAAPVSQDSVAQDSAAQNLQAKDSVEQKIAEQDSVKADSSKAIVAAADSAKVDSVKVDSAKTETVKTDSTKTAVVAADTAKADSAKIDSTKTAEKNEPSPIFFNVGIAGNGAFGMYNIKFVDSHFMAPEVGLGLSLLFGYSHVALRLEGGAKWEKIYVNEDMGTVNENFWRVGGGAFVRAMTGVNSGIFAEVGASFYTAMNKNKTLYQSDMFTWVLRAQKEIPAQLSVGYKFSRAFLSPEVAVYGSYDLLKSMNFEIGKGTKGSAWHAGLRIGGWLF